MGDDRPFQESDVNRDGQVWLDRNDTASAYVVINGPNKNPLGGSYTTYTMFNTAQGTLCEWSEEPSWEHDHLLTRIA